MEVNKFNDNAMDSVCFRFEFDMFWFATVQFVLLNCVSTCTWEMLSNCVVVNWPIAFISNHIICVSHPKKIAPKIWYYRIYFPFRKTNWQFNSNHWSVNHNPPNQFQSFKRTNRNTFQPCTLIVKIEHS